MLFPLQGCPTAVSSQCCQSHLCLLCVFSSEFAVEIHFTNILDIGKSVILQLLLALPVTIP